MIAEQERSRSLGTMEKTFHDDIVILKKEEELGSRMIHQPNSDSSVSEAFSEILKQVGEGGKYQWRVLFIASFCGIFFAFNSLSAAFLAATPNFVCNSYVKEFGDGSSNYSTDGIWNLPKCKYYKVVNNATIVYPDDRQPYNEVIEDRPCDSWLYDDSVYKSTVVTEWDLVCDKRWMMTSAQSSYMAGVLVGAIFLSELSDMYGRRTITLVSVVGFLISGIAIAFSTSFTIFIILRFLLGCFGSGMFLPNFVLVMEFVDAGTRTAMGMMYQGFFGFGFCLLPFIAFYLRSWRTLQLAMGVPSVILLAYYWILPESPRWLLSQGREEEALKILRKMAEVNGTSLPEEKELKGLLSKVIRHERSSGTILGKVANFFRNQFTLLRTPIMRRRCLISYFSWFVVSMIYYGLTFSGNNINASIYLMVFLSGIVEIPSYLLACFTTRRFGRRLNISFCFVICGVACMLILAVPKDMVWLNITLASLGKFFNSIAFAIAYIYSAELFPTNVRNLAVGTASMWARAGSALAPFIVDSLGAVHYAIPSTVFGILSLMAGMLTLLLPETGKRRLPETVDEVESMKR